MANFPIQYAETVPTGEISGVLADPAVAGAVPRAISEAGRAVTAIGQKIQDAENAMELSTLQRKSDEIWNAAYNTIRTTPDTEQRAKLYEKARQDASAATSKSTEVNNAYQMHLNNIFPRWEINFNNLDRQIRIQRIGDELDINDQYDYEKGAKESFVKRQYTAQSVGAQTPEMTEEKIATFDVTSEFAEIAVGMDADPQVAIGRLSAMKDLTEPQSKRKGNLISRAIGIQNRRRAELRTAQDETMLGLYENAFIKEEPLGWDDIANTNLEADDKISFWEKYERAQSEKMKLGVSVLEEGDPIVLAKTQSVIDLRPGDITPVEIYQLADVGLGLKHIPGLVNRLKRNRKELEDNPIAAKYKSELSRLLTAGVFGDKDNVETSNIYLDLSRKLDTFIKTKPAETEAQTFFGRLIREDVRTFGMLWGENVLPGFGDRPMEVTLTTEEGKEERFKVRFGDVIQIDNRYLQVIGREEGRIKWLEVSPQ